MRVIVVLALAVCSACAEKLVSVPAGDRTLVIDLDSESVRRELRPVNQEGQLRLPAYLYPSPQATPLRAHFDTASGISSATFAAAGTADQVFAYYRQVFQANGWTVSPPMGGGRGGSILSAQRRGASASVLFSVFGGQPQFTVTHAPSKAANARRSYEVVSFDPTTALLLVREETTGDLFHLTPRAMLENNLNRPGAAVSRGAGAPAWLPVYPNALPPRPEKKLVFLMRPTREYRTSDPPRRVFEFYREALISAGAQILSESSVASGRQFSLKALRGDDGVEILVERVSYLFEPLKPRIPDETAIGIRYTVPRR
ncbi:MAG TPA: hypothetical protein VFL57_13830 [Bryobacteraceae bacterium]|nr:hypothetical protein [Bryobacteraceae bacterium]